MKVASTVWSGGKTGDNIKGSPITIIPLAKGGLPKEKNLFLLCKACWERYKQQEFHAAQRETLRVYLTKWYEDWNIKQLITL